MNSTVENADEGAERLLRLFQELLSTLPPDTATLNSKRTERDDGTIVWLKPVRKHAAELCAHVEDRNLSLIDVSFGAGTTFELPSESRLPGDVTFDIILEAVRRMGLATLAGRCREYFGFLGIRGTIELSDDEILRASSFLHPRLFPKLVRYEPYA
jgi:hypothetical protein